MSSFDKSFHLTFSVHVIYSHEGVLRDVNAGRRASVVDAPPQAARRCEGNHKNWKGKRPRMS